jgi:hypothetical protein
MRFLSCRPDVFLGGLSCLAQRDGLGSPAFTLWRHFALFRCLPLPLLRPDCDVDGP